MRIIPLEVNDEVRDQIGRAENHKKQSGIVSLNGDFEVTSYWVGELYRVDIKLPKEKEVIV